MCQPVTQSLVSLSDSVKIQFDRQSKQQMRGKTHQPGHSSAPGDHHRGWWGGWGGWCNCKHLGTGLGNTGGQSPILYFCIWDVLEDIWYGQLAAAQTSWQSLEAVNAGLLVGFRAKDSAQSTPLHSCLTPSCHTSVNPNFTFHMFTFASLSKLAEGIVQL